ncbi:hypothetical protein M422DRAFT_273326 [Sphaerobolus stellatus SS14]|uniref:TROVE domain-containing protein n=1 Tax=Sphaerobolus stellatus (strain SS14) TaxID=990650 RepID=A0A0C9UK94_SPHS4|nr:hypothetical protein M422DRAFT_273326 [Sphaerobolus stellatus SS14]
MTTKFQPKGPFQPASTDINTTSPSQSTRPVTLPHLPELYQPVDDVLNALFPQPTPSVSTKVEEVSHPFMDALKETANRAKTWNNADAYESTRSSTLDAFASLSQSTANDSFVSLLSNSWSEDPDVTLRIIWNLRSIHDGKSAREPFYRAFAWLYAYHPKTAIANLRYLVEPCIKRTVKKKAAKSNEDDMEIITMEEATGDSMDISAKEDEELVTRMPHGYWKDLLNILVLAATDELSTTTSFDALHVPREEKVRSRKNTRSRKNNNNLKKRKRVSESEVSLAEAKPTLSSEQRKEAAFARDREIAKNAKSEREVKHADGHAKLLKKLSSDRSFRALYVTVARLFADVLARDLAILRQVADEKTTAERRIQLSYSLTLVGKWAPSIGGSHDRICNIATPIAELLYANGDLPVQLGTLEQPLKQDVAHMLRISYTRWVTSPLRRFIEVPEVAMSAKQWDHVKYTRVPSKAMKQYKSLFHKHDEKRFSDYLLAVAQGKKKISGATLLPHELLKEAIVADGDKHDPTMKVNMQVVDAQWKSLVDRIKESGTLENALAVCDVSGSMGSISHMEHYSKHSPLPPILPALALSILLAQVARPPWGNSFISFSASPKLHSINMNQGLAEIARAMVYTEWGMNTDFNAVFSRLILPAAKANKLDPENMIKRLFVFTDMQFDQSLINRTPGTFKTEHQKVKEEFEAAGYQMPEIVYWNLAGAVSKPVTKDDEGVALVSGFSPGMLKIFLDGGDINVDDEVEVNTVEDEDGIVKVEKKKLDPIGVMMKALNKESFDGLKVYD